ncbi:polysaccharide biosynthesis protein [Croceivirga lutea]|uniref:lipopolysaccharide biosynthesis protein n=1 Tax=Croceivirga lutea TaxID=1775167 RepID=UPI001639BF1B|nr:oligosaccharide flippase family protein [Croceivirga lutea]GGG44011.1 polysaccharide biosynthesis protein [Croceivirga lutea]
MGIVVKQSIVNTLTTYVGFGLGAINTLFLYTQILEPTYYGLVTFILATAAIIMPLLALGVHNTLVKFYSEQKEERNGFLTLLLLSPLLVIVPLALLIYFKYENISNFLAQENAIAKDYVWYIFIIGLCMAYFEIFYAWSKVQLKSVFGNFMKEVFARLCVLILLICLSYEWLTLALFLKALVVVYVMRTVLMKLYAYKLRKPVLNFNFPTNTKQILNYSFLMILGGSAALILLEIDKFMINQYVAIENVAFYGVAVYIATVIIVPSRAMHQITYPLTAKLLNEKNLRGLKELYQKSSLTLFIASGIVFLLIVLNLKDLYTLLPKEYSKGFYIVFFIGLAKVFDSVLGNINSILYNSKYYKITLMLGVLLAITTIVLNIWLIPKMGIEGAAIASFISICIFNLVKLFFVKFKFGFHPFTKASFKILSTLVFLGLLFSYLQFPFHAIVNILIKSILVTAMYLGLLFRFNISEEVNQLLHRFIKK